MKRIILLIAILLFVFPAEAQTVYVTKTGEKYHLDGCRYLRKSAYPMTLSDAGSSGYTPCSVCNPDNPNPLRQKDGTHRRHHALQTHRATQTITATQCQGTTKKGNRCKRRAKTGQNFCWQHGG